MALAKTKKTPTSAAVPKARPAKPPGARVDKALKAHWQDAIGRFRAAKLAETTQWDEQYEALDEILESDPPLYLAAGYANARAFLKDELPGVDERSARRSCRVARHFDPSDEAEHGVTKLDALLDYLGASGAGSLAHVKVNTKKQTVLVPFGKTARRKPFAEASVAELRRAARAQRSKQGQRSAKESPVVVAVRAALAKAKLQAIGVSVHANLVTVSGIPTPHLKQVGRVLASADV